jgi:hypothetical protein
VVCLWGWIIVSIGVLCVALGMCGECGVSSVRLTPKPLLLPVLPCVTHIVIISD